MTTTQASKQTSATPHYLVTHSGPFHADDLFAYAVLKTLFPLAEVIRTRDAALMERLGSEAVVFDVGGLYEPEAGRYDHHQPGRPMREEGLAYSAFGLIWQHYGRAFIAARHELSPEDIEKVHGLLDKGLVRDIDAVDNGQIQPGQEGAMHAMSISSMLGSLRPDFDTDDPRAMDEAFEEAAEIALSLLAAKVRNAAAKLRSQVLVEQAIAERTDPRWIELPRGMNYQGPILALGPEAEDILYVLNPTSSGEWQINVVNVAHGSYEARKPLPEAWAGLRDDALAAVTGVPDTIFCHLGRFIAAARSRDGALALLSQALEAEGPETEAPETKTR